MDTITPVQSGSGNNDNKGITPHSLEMMSHYQMQFSFIPAKDDFHFPVHNKVKCKCHRKAPAFVK